MTLVIRYLSVSKRLPIVMKVPIGRLLFTFNKSHDARSHTPCSNSGTETQSMEVRILLFPLDYVCIYPLSLPPLAQKLVCVIYTAAILLLNH